MKIKYNVTGSRRKEMAHKIAEITGQECRYLFVPTYAYEIGDFNLAKDGTLTISDSADESMVANVLQKLEKAGFESENSYSEKTSEPEDDKLVIEMPFNFFDEKAIKNLKQIVENKSELFKAAFKTDNLEIQINEDTIDFPWFIVEQEKDKDAYCEFIQMLCEFAKNQKRINNKPDATDNPKYTMRCYLLRLGMIGDQFKNSRKVLLRNLDGSSAFRHGGADNEISK